MIADLQEELELVLRSAAQLQRLVPDAVLVGGSAAALHARHRLSFDHAHVLTDLVETIRVELPGGDVVTAPTVEEAIRVKACLVVVRNPGARLPRRRRVGRPDGWRPRCAPWSPPRA
jgi:hypothetical protein